MPKKLSEYNLSDILRVFNPSPNPRRITPVKIVINPDKITAILVKTRKLNFCFFFIEFDRECGFFDIVISVIEIIP